MRAERLKTPLALYTYCCSDIPHSLCVSGLSCQTHARTATTAITSAQHLRVQCGGDGGGGDFKQLPPATSKAPFIVVPWVVQRFDFRVLRQNRRIVAGTEARRDDC